MDKNTDNLNKALKRLLLCSRIREVTALGGPVTLRDMAYIAWLLNGLVWLMYGSSYPEERRISRWRRIIFFPGLSLLLGFLIVSKRFLNHYAHIALSWIKVSNAPPASKEENVSDKIGITDVPMRRNIRQRLGLIKKQIGFSVKYYLTAAGRALLRIMYVNISDCPKTSAEITGFIYSADKETPVIRVCLLLMCLGFYGSCIEVLTKRFNSGLDREETLYYLAIFMEEIGDKESSDKFRRLLKKLSIDKGAVTEARVINSGQKIDSARLKYGLLITTMFDTPVFRSSVLSLLNSDYSGEIVIVEEGNNKARQCEDFCKKYKIKYFKSEVFDGPDGCMNLGISKLSDDVDIVVSAHNDVLWPARWFYHLTAQWDKVYDSQKVGLMNLGYTQFTKDMNLVLNDLFSRGEYDQLFYLLMMMKQVPYLRGGIQDVRNTNLDQDFGLAFDAWHHNVDKMLIINGRYSVVSTFPRKIWLDLGGFIPGVLTADLEIMSYCMRNKKFILWTNNPPVIHSGSSDYRILSKAELERAAQILSNTNSEFNKKYGYDIGHFMFTYLAETSVIYQDEIVKAANALKFSDADFIFDDFFNRLENKKKSSCELACCFERDKCLRR